MEVHLKRNGEDANKIPLAMFFATPTAESNMADIAGLVSACAQVDDLRTIDVNSYSQVATERLA